MRDSGTVPDNKDSVEPPAEKSASLHETVQGFLDSIQNSIQNTLQRNIEERRDSDLGMFDLLNSSFETMQNAISSMKLATYAPDVHIQIPRSACKAYEFDRAAELIELGYTMAGKAMASRPDSRRKDATSTED
jgi:predicted acylesterase/phospholipase RssA